MSNDSLTTSAETQSVKPNVSDTPDAESNENILKRKLFRCDICDVTCTSLKPYEMHLNGAKHLKNTKNPNKKAKIESPVKATPPEPSPVKFTTTRTFKCKTCESVFPSKPELTAHLKKEHPIDSEALELQNLYLIPVFGYFCKLCKQFIKRESRYSHLELESHTSKIPDFKKQLGQTLLGQLIKKESSDASTEIPVKSEEKTE